jgi:hypothetical protein
MWECANMWSDFKSLGLWLRCGGDFTGYLVVDNKNVDSRRYKYFDKTKLQLCLALHYNH